MATGKEIRSALRRAQKLGCVVERGRSSHWKITMNGNSLWLPFSPKTDRRVAEALHQLDKFISINKEGTQ